MIPVRHSLKRFFHLLGYDVRRLRPPPQSDLLFDAASGGDATTILRLRGTDVDPNARRPDGATALALAAAGGHLEAIEALLDIGADPDVRTSEGWYPYHFAKHARHAKVVERLLQEHGGKEPRFDYVGQFLEKATAGNLSVYKTLFDSRSIERKAFFNIGSGNWRHPYWTNVDYASDYYDYDDNLIDIPWDISLLQPLKTESNSAELAYCSHTTEHLTDDQNRHMFREVHRILKQGGVFRITCPNIEIYHAGWQRKDPYFGQHYGHRDPRDTGEMSIWFVNEIATQLVQSMEGHRPPLLGRGAEIEKNLSRMSLEEACDHYCSQIDYSVQQRFPGNHINWWTNDKMKRELLSAGFSKVIISPPGGSVSPVMRDRAFFDTVNPTSSLYVDAIK